MKVLGEGTYGKCYLVRHRSTEEVLVLKQIEIMGMAQSEIDEAVREAQILQSLDHPFIVSFKGSFQTKEGYLNILMSYADGGDLS
jgi:serine/threonine protein kinase